MLLTFSHNKRYKNLVATNAYIHLIATSIIHVIVTHTTFINNTNYHGNIELSAHDQTLPRFLTLGHGYFNGEWY